MATKKLRPYFQAHTIIILTGSPIRAILYKPDAFGRLLKWAIKISEFDIEYHPRNAIKGKVLAEFIMGRLKVHSQGVEDKRWILETDGSSWTQGRGANMVLRTLERSTIAQAVKFAFVVSNNEDEYEVVLLRLRVAKQLSILAT